MLFLNKINLPLAIFTIVLRRFIDKFRSPKPEVSIACAVTDLILSSIPILKPVICGYLFVAGIYYAIRHLRRGNMVSITKRSSHRGFRLKDRRNGSDTNRSWVLNNLASDRDSKEKVLKYVASLTQQDSSQHSPESSICESNFDLSSYVSNPYYEPRCTVRRNYSNYGSPSSICSTVPPSSMNSSPRERKQTSKLTCPTEYDTPANASIESVQSFYRRVYGSPCESELSGIPTTLTMTSFCNDQDECRKERKKRKAEKRVSRFKRQRLSREDRDRSCSRKTRSGRIYGGSSISK